MKPTTLNGCPSDADPVINLAGSTYFVGGPTNVGVYAPGEGALLVDSGNDKEAARKLNRLLADRGWTVAGIVNTHSNADHAGGNAYFQGKDGCRVYATVEESSFIEAPVIEAAFLWGGFAPRELRNKFFEARPSRVTDRILFPEGPVKGGGFRFVPFHEGCEAFPLEGHFFSMIGVRTPDGVAFLADSLFGEEVLDKHKIPFIYNPKAFMETLRRLPSLEADIFVPSHGPVLHGSGALASLAARNLERAEAVAERVVASLGEGGAGFDDILSSVASSFGIRLDTAQYALVGSTIRSFLTYLYGEGRVEPRWEGNRLSWKKT